MQKPIIIIVVNVIVVAFFVYFGLGPSQLWKRVISSNGEISWLWFGFNIVLIDLLLLLVVTSISINLPSDSGKNTTLGDLEKPTFYVQLSDNLYDDTEMNKAGQIIYDGLITLPITEKTFLTDVFLEISFPAIIEKFETVKEVGVEGAKIQLGVANLIDVSKGKAPELHTQSLFIEVKEKQHVYQLYSKFSKTRFQNQYV